MCSGDNNKTCIHVENFMHMLTAVAVSKMAAYEIFILNWLKNIYCSVQTNPLLQNLYELDFYCANTQWKCAKNFISPHENEGSGNSKARLLEKFMGN